MKRTFIIICIVLLAVMVSAQDSTNRFVIPIRGWEMKIAGLDLFERTGLGMNLALN